MKILSIWIGCSWLAALVPIAAQEAPAADEPYELVRQLGSDRFDERTEADHRLFQIGLPAVPSLERALESEDLEIRTRARVLLEDLRYRFLAGGALERLSPGHVEPLLSRQPRTRREGALRLADHFARSPRSFAPAAAEIERVCRLAGKDWPDDSESFVIPLSSLGDVDAIVRLCERLGREGRFDRDIGLHREPGCYLGDPAAEVEAMERLDGDARLAAGFLIFLDATQDSSRPTLAAEDCRRAIRLALEIDVSAGGSRDLAVGLLVTAFGGPDAVGRLPGLLGAVLAEPAYERLLEQAILEPDRPEWRAAVVGAGPSLDAPSRELLGRILTRGGWFEGRSVEEIDRLLRD